MKVWGWAADRWGCYAYRLRWPLEEVARITGWDIGQGDTIIEPYRSDADVIIGQRVCLDGPSGLWLKWRAQGRRLIYELDDDFWHVPRYNEHGWNFFRRRNIMANIASSIRAADTVTCSTTVLADVVTGLFGHRDIRVIPNAVPPWLLDHEPTLRYDLGWGGSATHRADFDEVSRALRRILSGPGDYSMHVFGSCPPGLEKHTEDYGARLRVSPWTKTPDDFLRAIDYRIGIAPLTANMFNRSKSFIKILECAALGIPSIASAFGPYEVVDHEVTGLKVRYTHEWTAALRRLLADEEARTRMGVAARGWAAGHTTAVTGPLWAEAIKG